MIKLVVFDWNGTLLSDTSAALVGVNVRLESLGHPSISIKHYQEIFEIPSVKIYEKLGLSSQLLNEGPKEHSEAFYNAYEARAKNVRTRAGTREVLKYLDKAGINKIILSNHVKDRIIDQLKRLRLDSYFDAVLANDNDWSAHFKGKKERLVAYLENSIFKPNEVLIVGDSTEEIEIGKELGLHTVSISGGFVSTKRLKQAKPDVLIHKLRDLIEVIEEI